MSPSSCSAPWRASFSATSPKANILLYMHAYLCMCICIHVYTYIFGKAWRRTAGGVFCERCCFFLPTKIITRVLWHVDAECDNSLYVLSSFKFSYAISQTFLSLTCSLCPRKDFFYLTEASACNLELFRKARFARASAMSHDLVQSGCRRSSPERPAFSTLVLIFL